MGRRGKQAYLEAIRNRYHKAKCADKILDEFWGMRLSAQIRYTAFKPQAGQKGSPGWSAFAI
jgi:hypothetical protein